MKIVRYVYLQSFPREARIGALVHSTVIDLESAYRTYLIREGYCNENGAKRLSKEIIPNDVVQFLENGSVSMEAAEQALQFAENISSEMKEEKVILDLEEVK